MDGNLGARLRGLGNFCFLFLTYERVKRRLAQGPQSCCQKTDNGDCNYAYTGRVEISAPRLERHDPSWLWWKRGTKRNDCYPKNNWFIFNLVCLIEISELSSINTYRDTAWVCNHHGHRYPSEREVAGRCCCRLLHGLCSRRQYLQYSLLTLFDSDSSHRWSLCAHPLFHSTTQTEISFCIVTRQYWTAHQTFRWYFFYSSFSLLFSSSISRRPYRTRFKYLSSIFKLPRNFFPLSLSISLALSSIPFVYVV